MNLAFSTDDRLPPPTTAPGRGWSGSLVYGMLLPFTIVAVGFSGWYMVTGETPRDLAEILLQRPRISMPMPARPGPERPADGLIRPPSSPSAEKSGPPQVTLPTVAAAPPAAFDPTRLAPPPAAKPAESAPPPVAATQAAPTGSPQQTTAAVAAPAMAPAPSAGEAGETAHTPPPAASPTPPVVNAPAVASSSYVAPPPAPALAEPAIPPGGDSLAPPSFAQLPALKDPPKPLAPAPTPDLVRQTTSGPLPIRTADREAWKVYGRPISTLQSKPGPKIAVVVTGLGMSRDGTDSAIAKLPPDVSLSFSPYGSELAGWIRKARDNGHEVLLDLPLEPANFPQHDAGPLAVLASHSPGEAITHLEAILSKVGGYVGIAAPEHSPVTATESWAVLLQDLRERGLLFVGDGLVGVEDHSMPAAGAITLVADETPFRTAVDAKLERVLLAAKRDGSAIVTLSARPVSFERLLAFLASLPEKGVTLVPVSAVVRPEP